MKFFKFLPILLFSVLNNGFVINGTPHPQFPKRYSKVILESSNNLGDSFLNQSHYPKSRIENDVWRNEGFKWWNISELPKNLPTFPLPASPNSKNFFYSMTSASLTIVIKRFTHPMIYLNFSYYLGELNDTKELYSFSSLNGDILQKKSDSSENGKTSDSFSKDHQEQFIERNTTSNIPKGESIESEMKPTSTDLNTNPNRSGNFIPASRLAIPAANRPLFVMHKIARRKRSEPIPESGPSTATSKSMNSAVGNKIPNGSSTNDTLLALGQAVAIIKSAAAEVLRKGAAALATNTSDSGYMLQRLRRTQSSDEVYATRKDNASQNHDFALVDDVSLHSGGSGRIVHVRGSNEDDPTIHFNDNSTNGLGKKVVLSRSKSEKNGSKIGSRDEKKGKSGQRGADETVERKNENDNDKEVEDSSSSSSSSSSEEDISVHDSQVKKKIPYKTRRASENRNRPPGLYVTVNDDIVFDNWGGIWDRHYSVGKWTGSKVLKKGKWNESCIWMDWTEMPESRDLKITFEWEPFDQRRILFLSDIIISALMPKLGTQEPVLRKSNFDDKSMPESDILKENSDSKTGKVYIMVGVNDTSDLMKTIAERNETIRQNIKEAVMSKDHEISSLSNKSARISGISNTTVNFGDNSLPHEHVRSSVKMNTVALKKSVTGRKLVHKNSESEWKTSLFATILTVGLLLSITGVLVKKRIDLAKRGRNSVR